MVEEEYVDQGAWRDPAGRPDVIDEIADQFERPGAAEFWSRGAAARAWPPHSPGWVERRAG